MRLTAFSEIAAHLSESITSEQTIIVDAFGGCGGSAIALARTGRWDHVYGIERDAATLLCAQHNAHVYGVQELITWVHGDCFEILENHLGHLRKKFVIFASPPWGGTSIK